MDRAQTALCLVALLFQGAPSSFAVWILAGNRTHAETSSEIGPFVSWNETSCSSGGMTVGMEGWEYGRAMTLSTSAKTPEQLIRIDRDQIPIIFGHHLR